MTYKNDKLRDLTPLTTTFVVGESPTAAKLQGMIRQADSAIEYLENKMGDIAGEEGLYNTWATTLARNIGDYSKLTPAVLPNFEIVSYEQFLELGKTEHELDMIPIGELNDVLDSTMDPCVVQSQFKNSVAELQAPGDWTIEGSYIENGKVKRGRKLVTHSPSSGGSIIFKRVTSGRGSSLEKSSENTIPSIAQAEFGGPFITIEPIDPAARTYLVTLPERVKMYDRLGEIVDFSASNSAAGIGLNSQHELPQWFFDVNGLNLASDDTNGEPKSIPLNLIVLYDWDAKKEVEGIIALKASPTPAARKFQFILQTKSDVILNLVNGRYLISVPGNSIAEQLQALVNSVYNNTGNGNEMMRLFNHKNLLGLRTTSTDITNRSAYYGASNIDNNDHSMYLHRNGFTDSDKGAGGNVMRGSLVIGSQNTGADDTTHENFNVDTDSFSLHFGNILNGPEVKYLKAGSYTIDHAAGSIPLGMVDSGLLIKGSISDLDPSRRNIFLEGDIRSNGNIVLGLNNNDTIYVQGKMYVNDELTMIPRTTAGIIAEEGKLVYSNTEKALVLNNGTKWISPWNYSGYTTTIGDGVTSFGKHNGQTAATFNAAIADVGAGGTIKVLPGSYNFLSNKVTIPANIKIEGSGEATVIQCNLVPFEIAGVNSGISDLKIKGASVALNVSERNAILKDILIEDCAKGPVLSAQAINSKISGLRYISTLEKVGYTGNESIKTYESVEVSAINYPNGSSVWDWSNKEDQLSEFMIESGSLNISFDDALDGAVGRGAFKVTGTGTFVSRKMLPINPNVGIGAHINIASLGGSAIVSIGVQCYDKNYNLLGVKDFLLESLLLTNDTIESSFYKNLMSGVKAAGMYFPFGTRYVRPIFTITANTDGIGFDSFEIMNLSYARDITPYLNMKFVGEIMTAAFTNEPDQFLLCDGREISRSTYSELFNAIGIAHGSGDGVNTFRIPDYRGVFLRGVDGSRGMDPDKNSRVAMNPGGNVGNLVGSMQMDQFQSHTHGYHKSDNGSSNNGTGSDPSKKNFNTRQTTAVGGNETRPKNAYVNYFIRYTLNAPV